MTLDEALAKIQTAISNINADADLAALKTAQSASVAAITAELAALAQSKSSLEALQATIVDHDTKVGSMIEGYMTALKPDPTWLTNGLIKETSEVYRDLLVQPTTKALDPAIKAVSDEELARRSAVVDKTVATSKALVALAAAKADTAAAKAKTESLVSTLKGLAAAAKKESDAAKVLLAKATKEAELAQKAKQGASALQGQIDAIDEDMKKRDKQIADLESEIEVAGESVSPEKLEELAELKEDKQQLIQSRVVLATDHYKIAKEHAEHARIGILLLGLAKATLTRLDAEVTAPSGADTAVDLAEKLARGALYGKMHLDTVTKNLRAIWNAALDDWKAKAAAEAAAEVILRQAKIAQSIAEGFLKLFLDKPEDRQLDTFKAEFEKIGPPAPSSP